MQVEQGGAIGCTVEDTGSSAAPGFSLLMLQALSG